MKITKKELNEMIEEAIKTKLKLNESTDGKSIIQDIQNKVIGKSTKQISAAISKTLKNKQVRVYDYAYEGKILDIKTTYDGSGHFTYKYLFTPTNFIAGYEGENDDPGTNRKIWIELLWGNFELI